MKNFVRSKYLNIKFSIIALFVMISILPPLVYGDHFLRKKVIDNSANSISDLVERLVPAVVNISTTQTASNKMKHFGMGDLPDEFFRFFHKNDVNPFFRGSGKIISLGSGFLIDKNGHIITNNHVVDSADEINVTLSDNENIIYKAKIIGKDPKTDLAILKIEAKKDLPFVKFGKSDKARVGDPVIAIGNSFGLGGTVTRGIISAKGRHLEFNNFDEFIQTDASINQGNSGGPMFNLDGDVIGVNTAIISPSGGNVGVGFAIPSNSVKPVVAQLLKKGKVERGWLGVKIQKVTNEIASAFGLNETKGALVSSVVSNGPAKRAGIVVGDIILRFNGIEIKSWNQLPRIVGEAEIGKTVPVIIYRNKAIRNIEVKVEKPDSKYGDENEENQEKNDDSDYVLGMVLKSLDQELRNLYNINEDLKGLVITKLKPGSNAYTKFKPGDVILQISSDGYSTDLSSVKDFKKHIDLARKNKESAVVLLVSVQGSTMFVPMELD